jgi:integrase
MSKRHNGEGQVRQRSDGRWEARITVVAADGSRKRVSFYGATAEAVRDQMKTGRDRADKREPIRDSTRRFGEYGQHWLDNVLDVSDRAAATKSLYRRLMKTHLIPALGGKPLGKLVKSDVEALLGRLKRQGLSQSSVKQVFLVLRMTLTSAVDDGLLASNPAAKITTPQVEREEADFLTPAQSRALLAALGDLRYADAVRLTLATGMRRGEVAGLKWSDVDLRKSVLRVRRTLNRIDGELVAGMPKTEKSRRTIPLTEATVAMLKRHKATQAAERLAAGDQWIDEDWVFSTALGGRTDPRLSILRTVEIAAKRAKWVDDEGVEHTGLVASAHALRHAAGSAMVDAGASLPTVRDILGHSSVAITGDIYSHPPEASARAAVDGWAGELGL